MTTRTTNPFKTFFDDIHVTHEFSETLVDVEQIQVGSDTAQTGLSELPELIFGTTFGGVSSLHTRLLFDKIRKGEPVVIFDPKGSSYPISRRKAKKRLMAAGLRPAEANALIREIVGRPGQVLRLRAAMKYRRRMKADWFPWDSCVR